MTTDVIFCPDSLLNLYFLYIKRKLLLHVIVLYAYFCNLALSLHKRNDKTALFLVCLQRVESLRGEMVPGKK